MSQIKPLVAAVQGIWNNPYLKSVQGLAPSDENHSGVVRLWMYELYENAIQEDHKKRGIVKQDDEQPKTATSRPKAPVKPKTRPRRKAQVRPEQVTPYKPLPKYAPVFVRAVENESIIANIEQVLDNLHKNPLNILTIPKKAAKSKSVTKIDHKVKRKKEEEWLLMLAA